MNRNIVRLSIAGTAGLFLGVAAPLAASAHVTIDPSAAEPGAYTVVTVKVPNESATASTNKVELQLPTDTPFSSVRYVPVPGWSAELVTETLPEPVTVGDTEIAEAITSVIWTAEPGSEIGDGQLQQFDLSVGPVPDTGSVMLPAIQTYTDGEVVEWSEEGEDAENPAPVLYITDAPVADHHSSSDEQTEDATAASSNEAAASTTAANSDDVLARVFGIGGLILGAIAVVIAIASRRRSAAS